MNVSLLYITVCTSPSCFFFFFNDTATTEIYTLSLHDALPICSDEAVVHNGRRACGRTLGGRWNYRCSANDGRCDQPPIRGTYVCPAFVDKCAVLHRRYTENRLRSVALQSIRKNSAGRGTVTRRTGCKSSLTLSSGLCCWGPVSDSVIYGRIGKPRPLRRTGPLPTVKRRVLRSLMPS